MRRDVAALVLYNAEGKVLLQHRTDDAPRLAGHWALFGGGIEEGETPEQALKRELMEEIEWQVKNPKKVCEVDLQPWGYETLLHMYTELCTDASALVLHEGKGWGWFSKEEAKDLQISDWDRQALEQVFSLL